MKILLIFDKIFDKKEQKYEKNAFIKRFRIGSKCNHRDTFLCRDRKIKCQTVKVAFGMGL